jgi:hypothetical protein
MSGLDPILAFFGRFEELPLNTRPHKLYLSYSILPQS